MMKFTATSTSSSSSSTPRTPAARGTKGRRQRNSLFVSPISARTVDPTSLAAKGKDPGAYFGKFLIMLVLEENLDDIECFVAEKGANPNFVDPDDFTPLYVAVKHKLNECAKKLVELGALITKATNTYPSPLHLAFQTNNTELVEFFAARLRTAETEWASARREAAASRTDEGPSRKRKRVEAEPAAQNGVASE